jgi:molybdopterin synthase catalytic subunit
VQHITPALEEKEIIMNLDALINKVKTHPEFDKAGMLLCHNGVVRGTSRDGRKVSGLKVAVDHEKLRHVIREHKKRPGILEILVEIAEDKDLSVGDDVMFLVVAGDIRENVISALNDTLNAIKTSVTSKTEFFV